MAIIRRLCAAELSLLAALSIFFPSQAVACACCTEIGQRFEQTGTLENYERGELSNVRFASTAHLFTDPGFPDTVEGINNPLDQSYQVKVMQKPTEWIFDFVDAQGKTGRIVFPLPKRFSRFEIDPREVGQTPGGNGPVLYKEWRLQGISKLSGNLAAKGAWAHARLILHGRGNGCTSAIDFENWTLSVLGKQINFKFLGATMR